MPVVSAGGREMQPPKKLAVVAVPVDLQSLVDTHDEPFVVIDSRGRCLRALRCLRLL